MTDDEKKPRPVSRGEKFVTKYGVQAAQTYCGDPGPEKLRIPPPGHFLYDPDSPTTFDEIKVRQIEADGHMIDDVEVWTDPDKGILWVIDGRDRTLAVREVNRRRAAEGREPVLMRLMPLPRGTTEQQAIARIAIKNLHRRVPKPSTYAHHIRMQRKAGFSWEAIAQHLHIETDDAEQWCRKRLPLAYCEPEVIAAFDSGEFPLSAAPHFGGRNAEGGGALDRVEQLALLEQKRGEKQAVKDNPQPRQVPTKVRERVRAALSNGESANLCHQDQMIAEGFAAALAYVAGDEDVLKKWPDIAAIVRAAAEKSS